MARKLWPTLLEAPQGGVPPRGLVRWRWRWPGALPLEFAPALGKQLDSPLGTPPLAPDEQKGCLRKSMYRGPGPRRAPFACGRCSPPTMSPPPRDPPAPVHWFGFTLKGSAAARQGEITRLEWELYVVCGQVLIPSFLLCMVAKAPISRRLPGGKPRDDGGLVCMLPVEGIL